MLPSLLSVTLLLASTDEKRMTLLQEKKKKGLWLGNCFPRAVDSTHLGVGLLLRCFKQLSAPHLATQRLPWAR